MTAFTSFIARGIVLQCLPDTRFSVKLESGKEVLCYLSGKMRLHRIKVIVGDTVEIVLDPMGGKATNRIVRRIDR